MWHFFKCTILVLCSGCIIYACFLMLFSITIRVVIYCLKQNTDAGKGLHDFITGIHFVSYFVLRFTKVHRNRGVIVMAL